jgi:hypothetical protein
VGGPDPVPLPRRTAQETHERLASATSEVDLVDGRQAGCRRQSPADSSHAMRITPRARAALAKLRNDAKP